MNLNFAKSCGIASYDTMCVDYIIRRCIMYKFNLRLIYAIKLIGKRNYS